MKKCEPISNRRRLSRMMKRHSAPIMVFEMRALLLRAAILGLSLSAFACVEGPVLSLTDAGIEGPQKEDSESPFVIGGDAEGACEDTEPYLLLDNGSGNTVCAGKLAESLFRFALCTCGDTVIFGGLYSDSFDSANATLEDADEVGGALGVNGELSVLGDLYVGGTVVTAGPVGMTLYGRSTVFGDLSVGGTLIFDEPLFVARDATAAGDLLNYSTADIERDLHVSGMIADRDSVTVGGTVYEDSVSVSPACACDDEALLDIAAMIDAAKRDNQNEIIGLDVDDLTGLGGDVEITLRCGRYFVNRIDGFGKLTFNIEGPVALFVSEDFDFAGDLDLILGSSGALDVFVAGNLELTGIDDFWDISRPSKVRFYVGGSEDVLLTNVTGFNLYAPRARAVIDGGLILGSIFAGSFFSTNGAIVHYDRDVLREAERCGESDEISSPCGATGSSCTVDAECCVPLVCDRDTCGPLGVIL